MMVPNHSCSLGLSKESDSFLYFTYYLFSIICNAVHCICAIIAPLQRTRMVQDGIFFPPLGVRWYVEVGKNDELVQRRTPLDGVPLFR